MNSEDERGLPETDLCGTFLTSMRRTMRTIETTITITEDGQITASAPSGVAPGKRKAVLVLMDEPELEHKRRPLPVIHHARLARNVSLRREEIYDDTGR